MGIYSDNFYSWLERQNKVENIIMDAADFRDEDHPREGKGSSKGGQFAKKPETLAKEDDNDNIDPTKAPHPNDDSTSKESRSKYRTLRDAQAKKVKGMGTFNLMTGEPITNRTTGFQVSFQEATTESPNHGSYITDEEYDRKIEALKKEIGTDPELGHWDEDEISFHCNSLDTALAIARRHNQEAIWNWAKSEPIMNEDFVGRTHWTDRNNHATKSYHPAKKISNL